MSVLVIYELVPEDTKFYLVPEEVYAKVAKDIDHLHDKMINGDEFEPQMDTLMHVVAKEEHVETVTPYTALFVPYELELENGKPIDATNITKVVHTGILL